MIMNTHTRACTPEKRTHTRVGGHGRFAGSRDRVSRDNRSAVPRTRARRAILRITFYFYGSNILMERLIRPIRERPNTFALFLPQLPLGAAPWVVGAESRMCYVDRFDN